MADKEPFRFPFNAESTAEATFALCIKERATPASIALILNDFLALRLGALRLGAMVRHLIHHYKLRALKQCLQCFLSLATEL